MITLTMRPAVQMKELCDGNGWEICCRGRDHHGHLKIGNVSVAFDDWNRFDAGDEEYSGLVVQLHELTDDPVRLNNESVRVGTPEESLLLALATDLGYTISKNEESADDVQNADC